MARSPEMALERALPEADATLTAEIVRFTNQPLDAIIQHLSLNWDDP
ncbi:MAG: hypothetical protein KJN93_04015 [Alphaproteobacteria bacterium]|nr:hypothetical protein [Alphaproteobacteria bacterium]NNF23419.1 hypothetical protein [Paracoccaceae bacterium]